MLKGSWMRKQWTRKLLLLTVAGAMLSVAALVSGASDPNESAAPRSRVFKFRNITSSQAKDILTQLQIGTEYNTLTADVLIVTGQVGTDLIKASQVLEMLDRSEPSQLRTLMVRTETEPLPDPEQFGAQLKTISAGTLLDSPPAQAAKPAIIDIVDNKLIAVAPAAVLDEIEAALKEWKGRQGTTAEKPEPAPAAPAETAAPVTPAEPVVTEPIVPEPVLTEPNVVAVEEKTTLEKLAGQLFAETEEADAIGVVTEPEMASEQPSEAVEETPESFMEDALLETLAEAEKKAQQRREQEAAAQAPLAPVTAPAPDPVQPPAVVPTPLTEEPTNPTQDAAERMILELMRQAQEQQAEPAETPEPLPEEVVEVPAKVVDVQPVVPQPETVSTPLKDEIDGLREQLARLEQMLSERNAPQPVKEEVPPVSAPEVTIDPALAEKELETTLELPQEIDLENLVDLVGKQLGLNYLYDKAILQGQKVQLKVHGGKIKVGETYALLESVLRFKGFIMTRRDGFVTILRAADMPRAEPMLREPGEPIPAGEIVVSTVFHLNHVNVNNAETMLRGMNLGTTFTKIAETNTLIVTDYAYRMGQIGQVVEMIDVKGEPKEYKFRTLSYLRPSDLVPKLKELAGQLQGVDLQISSPSPAAPTPMRTVTTRDPTTGRTTTQQVPAATVTPSAQGQAQPDAVFIDTDDRTNRVLIAGKPAQIVLVNELIDALDIPQYDLKYVREYIIQYVEAGEVVNVLNGLGLASVSASTQGSANQAQTGRLTAAQTRAAAAAQGQPQPQPQPQPVTSPTAAARSGSPEQPYISIRPATNSLLVNATAEQHKSIELVIAHVDVIQKDQRTIRQYEIQHVDTQEIMDTLANLGIVASQQSQGSSSDTRSTAAARTAGRTAQPPQMVQTAEGAMTMSLPTAEGGSEIDITAEQPQIAVLPVTNSLLVFATPRQHDAIALVIAHADRLPIQTTTPYVVYALENQDPLELADVLTTLIGQTVKEAAQPSSPDAKIQTAASPQTQSVIPTLEEQQITIVPDEMSYSLIVYANKRNQQWISELIKELDEYRPQVLLDCTLVQISKDDQFQYSIDIAGKTYDGTSLQPGTPVTRPTGVTAPFSSDTLSDASTIGGNITAFLNTGSVQAVLRAMQEKGFGRVMSQPKLLVNDNQEGEIKSETKTSIAQQKSIIQPSSDQGQTITTTDVSFNEYSAGVTLKIKPHISKGDMLRLEITLSRADFRLQPDVIVAGDTYPRPPDILSTDVTSVATVPDGTTIVLGGLEAVTQNKSQSKVPILGDIPLLGTLFRSVDNTDEQSKLYIFVKANVIRPGDQIGGLNDIRRVSGKYREEFESMEQRFQRQDDFPGIKPKPMDPATVLEQDDEYLENLEQRLQEMDLEKSSAPQESGL